MAAETPVSFGNFRLDPQNACVWRGTEMIKLTPKAFAVLHYLIEHQGRVVTKEELFTEVWPETVVSEVALSVCVREIRKSLEDDAKVPQYIETVHRRGFRFIGKVVSSQLSVISQTKGVSGQEEQRQANGENGSASRVQSLESNGQSLASSVQSPESEERKPLESGQSLDAKSDHTGLAHYLWGLRRGNPMWLPVGRAATQGRPYTNN
jgi:DNA-binding winged helix-turn-helix (wHTH) protein